MSCYMVEPSTIEKILTHLEQINQLDNLIHAGHLLLAHGREPVCLGNVAWQTAADGLQTMNAEAVVAYYGTERLYPEETTLWLVDTVRRAATRPVSTYKALDCYLYQCCEGDIPSSPLYLWLHEQQTKLAHSIMRHLPEYEAAPWG